MNISEGNIFQVMRLILPEHRATMKRWQRERGIKKQPTLSEDELENMQYVISEAIQDGSKVRLTLFGEHDDMVLDGFPVFDGRLKVRTEDGYQTVEVGRLIRAQLV